jgi:signal transduction histidine kinase
MLAQLASFRFRLLVAMIAAAAVGLLGAKFAVESIEHGEERSILRQEARAPARSTARLAAAGADSARFRAVQSVLGDDRLEVFRNGRRVFAGPPAKGTLTVTATAHFPGGFVRVTAGANENVQIPLELTLVLGAVVLLVIAVAVLTATLIARSVRDPIARTIDAADRLARGDLSARMGTQGPEEFARLAEAFDEMAGRLEAADQEQRRFLADVTHEIATPVNSLSGFALALADGSASTETEREEAARLIKQEAVRLDSLLDELRSLTQLDFVGSPRLEPVDLGRFTADLVGRLQKAADDAEVTLELESTHLEIACDRRLLETVVVNFATNAIRYTPRGGRVRLAARRRGRDAVIAVTDTGIGIAPEHRPRIFDRLYRVDDARDRERGGSGLGLALAWRAAQALGGHIELDSELGRGSEFRLVLPLDPARRTVGPTPGTAAVA